MDSMKKQPYIDVYSFIGTRVPLVLENHEAVTIPSFVASFIALLRGQVESVFLSHNVIV